MATGTVKWYNKSKGFGYITPDGGGDAVFFHFNCITSDDIDLLEGTKVNFVVMQGMRGPLATNITLAG